MKLYRIALNWLLEQTNMTYPDWKRIKRIHKLLPKLHDRMMREEGY